MQPKGPGPSHGHGHGSFAWSPTRPFRASSMMASRRDASKAAAAWAASCSGVGPPGAEGAGAAAAPGLGFGGGTALRRLGESLKDVMKPLSQGQCGCKVSKLAPVRGVHMCVCSSGVVCKFEPHQGGRSAWPAVTILFRPARCHRAAGSARAYHR